MLPLLQAHNLSKTYGRELVFSELSFLVSEGMHIGLAGRNGAGKTTLLKMLSGDEESDTGTIQHMPACKLGVIRQHEILPSDGTVLQYLEHTSQKPAWECAKLAARFGLKKAHLEQVPNALSGGFQMRVKILAMLLQDPNLLLLDEPVNYLDLPTLLLLETFLKDYKGAFLLTSHDREFMQNTCTTTWEIERGCLTTFSGDIETYLDWKEEQEEYMRKTNKRLRREIAHTQEFVDRFRYKASLASQAQSKIKHIAKLRTQLKQIGTDLPTVAFKINCPPVPPGTAIRSKDLVIGYNNQPLAHGTDLDILRGAKVAIVGENGQGKSTLLKTLMGIIPPVSGSLKWWHNANVGIFLQQGETALPQNLTVLEALTQAAPAYVSAERILATAGAFLFHQDDLEKPYSVLSGGQKSRVRLAQIMLKEYNVLLLDEPTNHLDAETVDVLAEALKNYEGTVFVVSHARTFMNTLVDTIYEVQDGEIHHYTGTYEEYVEDLMTLTKEKTSQALNESSPEDSQKRQASLQAKTTRRAQQKIESKLKVLDKEKSEILAYFFENPTDYAPVKATRLSEINEEITALEEEWLSLIANK